MAKNPNHFDTKKHNKNDKVATPGQVRDLVMQEAKRRGWSWFTPADASAAVGSFIQETGGFIRSVIEFEWKGDAGTAHGLMQWRGVRYKNLLRFAKEKGMNPRDIRTQVSFAFEEGTSGSKYADFGSIRAFKEMRQSKTLEGKATAFIHAERPAGYGKGSGNAALYAHDRSKRINHAKTAMGDKSGGNMSYQSGNTDGYGQLDQYDPRGNNPLSSMSGSLGVDNTHAFDVNNALGANPMDQQSFDENNPANFLQRYRQTANQRQNPKLDLKFGRADMDEDSRFNVSDTLGLQNRFTI